MYSSILHPVDPEPMLPWAIALKEVFTDPFHVAGTLWAPLNDSLTPGTRIIDPISAAAVTTSEHPTAEYVRALCH